jgi:hypothetical protein
MAGDVTSAPTSAYFFYPPLYSVVHTPNNIPVHHETNCATGTPEERFRIKDRYITLKLPDKLTYLPDSIW